MTLRWIDAQIRKDEEEEFETMRAFSEYIASFINSEGVAKVQDRRKQGNSVSDEDFSKILENLTGKKIDLPKRKN